jgi:hypothetical protein
MTATGLFDLFASLLALIAAIFIFDQHVARPRPYKLLWTLGLLFYGLAAGAVFAAEVGHWNAVEFKAWYYFGGVLTAAFLGLGSLYLQAPRRVAQVAVGIGAALGLYGGVRIATLPLGAEGARLATLSTAVVTGKTFLDVVPADLRITAALMSIAGALFLFGGAAWSAWGFYRRHAPAYRVLSMALLALGAVFPSILTGLQALGNSGGAALGELLGAACILAGLLVSLDVVTVFRVPFTHIVLRERRAGAVGEGVGA